MSTTSGNSEGGVQPVKARDHWILLHAGSRGTFKPDHVFRMISKDRSVMGDVLMLFTSEGAVDGWIAYLATRNLPVNACKVATADELTDLLADLKDRGTTHVLIDPTRDLKPEEYLPIERVIIDFQVSE